MLVPKNLILHGRIENMHKLITFLLLFVVGQCFALPVPAIIGAKNQALMTSTMSGIIDKIPFKEGQIFKKNDLLIEFKCKKQFAELAKAKAILDNKNSVYKGYKRLINLKAASRIELVEAESNAKEAAASWKLASYNVEDCSIKAPYDGQVTKKYVQKFERVDIGKPLMDIVNFEELEIKIIAPSQWLGWIKEGIQFEIFVKETNKSYLAKVVRFNHNIDPISLTFTVYADFVSKPENIGPGMSGEVLFKEAKSREP